MILLYLVSVADLIQKIVVLYMYESSGLIQHLVRAAAFRAYFKPSWIGDPLDMGVTVRLSRPLSNWERLRPFIVVCRSEVVHAMTHGPRLRTRTPSDSHQNATTSQLK